MKKYETHLHTSEVSACASASGAEQARRYKQEGYDGICVTDHFFNGNSRVDPHADWKTKVDQYMLGYDNARAEGDKIGLKVFFGIEYSYNGADVIFLGLDRQWLYDNSDALEISFYEFAQRAHEAGALLIHAHPFREADYIREVKLLPQWVDAVEVYNSGNREEIYNDRAVWYADQYGIKPRTGGTDNHHLSVDSRRLSGIMCEQELGTVEDLTAAIKEDRVTPIIPTLKAGEEGMA